MQGHIVSITDGKIGMTRNKNVFLSRPVLNASCRADLCWNAPILLAMYVRRQKAVYREIQNYSPWGHCLFRCQEKPRVQQVSAARVACCKVTDARPPTEPNIEA